MENKRFKMFIGITIIVIVVALSGMYIYNKLQENKEVYLAEYTPQEEISDEQFRSTIVRLYFMDGESNDLRVESRCVDAKELITNPYLTLVNLLIQGPNDKALRNALPEGTSVNSATLSGDTVILDLSETFLTNQPGGAASEQASIYAIVNTLTELTEVNSVKFIFDGKEGLTFEDNAKSFDDPFSRITL